MFFVFLIDNKTLADALNAFLRDYPVRFIANGQGVCGLRFGVNRPTHIIDLMQNRDRAGFEEWFDSCIVPMMYNAEYYKRY